MVTKLFKKYLFLYWRILKFNLVREMQYRGNFWAVNIVTFLWSASQVLYYVFIFNYVKNIKGWNLGQLLVLTGLFIVFNSIFKSVFEENFTHLPRAIYRGELDFVLTKPINSQFLVTLSRFSLRSLLRIIAGLGILIWALAAYRLQITFSGALMAAVAMFFGFVIIYSFWFMTLILAFWVGNIENLYYLFMPIFSISRNPIDIFPRAIQGLFSFVIPLTFVATIPTQVLLGRDIGQMLLLGFVLAGFSLWISHQLWLTALRSYTSASS
ncbi:hypothetical protein A2160_00140 [Candidatus Beckwithbacteria bacterium RBG_13_42_9]|uniref:ABC transporter permease n=1 Tax=Candidatus Beckwithbacteria bacterium RBG_13_42_9 TaxID=1797457 RepID=A0A1F5E4Z6_9BACT|nr:MAG: hypothetical protein A2160_00140 [Candidatus Beckwithbacteria bacterium RBG_13_42_9]